MPRQRQLFLNPGSRRPFALSVHQPWASLIVNGYKDVENRTWCTNHRGPLLIHASHKYVDHDGWSAYSLLLGGRLDDLPRGAIIGRVEVIDCVRDSTSSWAFPGHWHWLLADPAHFAEPVVANGRRGLWRPAELDDVSTGAYTESQDQTEP